MRKINFTSNINCGSKEGIKHRRRRRNNMKSRPTNSASTVSVSASGANESTVTVVQVPATTTKIVRRSRPQTNRYHEQRSRLQMKIPYHRRHHNHHRHLSQCPLLIILTFQLCSFLLFHHHAPRNTHTHCHHMNILHLNLLPKTHAFQQPTSFILHQHQHQFLYQNEHRLQQQLQQQQRQQQRQTDKFYHQTFINTIHTNVGVAAAAVRHKKLQLQLLPSTKNYNNFNNNNNCDNDNNDNNAIINFRQKKPTTHHQVGFSTQLHSSSESNDNDQPTTTTAATSTTTSTSTSTSTSKTTTTTKPGVIEVPMPTAAGGYSHTSASKAKISAANRGKTPWNKGKTRSEETKARIAEGVRRRNRERFLKKLEEMGVTEEEYEQQKKEERRRKDAERRKRKTANGGYRLTEETKKKISKVLKEKHAKGEVKKREYNGPYRKGFSHSEETKQKIRESLKKKWAEDTEYQDKMRQSSKKNNSESSRTKISKTLKEKWQDPAFREKMIKAMKQNRAPKSAASEAQRAKISAAMKKKWQDAEYRKKAMKGMEQYRESLPPRPKKKTKMVSKAAATIQVDDVFAVTPIKAGTKKKRKRASSSSSSVKVGSTSAAKKKTKTKKKKKKKKSTVTLAKTAKAVEGQGPKNGEKNGKSKEKNDDGDISRMREERRDLYDLLYGDEPEEIVSDEESFNPVIPDPLSESQNPAMAFFGGGVDMLDDENLDDFDPYGLDDR